MIVDFYTMLNYVIGFMCIIVGLYIYFKPKESAKRFDINLTNKPKEVNIEDIKEVVK